MSVPPSINWPLFVTTSLVVCDAGEYESPNASRHCKAMFIDSLISTGGNRISIGYSVSKEL